MQLRKRLVVASPLIACTIVFACGGDDSTPATGSEGRACFGNGTCNAGLTCLSDLCVNATVDASGPDATHEAAPPDAPMEANELDTGTIDAPTASDASDASDADASDAPRPLAEWSRLIDAAEGGDGPWMARDGSGHLIVGASAGGSFTVDKLDEATGAIVWSRRYNGPNTWLTSVATGPGDVVYLAGFSNAGFDPGGGMLPPGAFVVKLDATGQFVWAKPYFTPTTGAVATVMATSTGAVIVFGWFNGTADFGGGSVMTDGDDVFVLKLDAGGSYVSAKVFGAPGTQRARQAVTDGSDRIAIAGTFDGSIDFGGGALPGPAVGSGSSNVYVARLDASGNHLASKQLNATHAGLNALATNAAGDIAITGDFNAPIDLGGGILMPNGDDLFVAKLTPTLGYVWGKQLGDAAAQTGTAAMIEDDGTVTIGASIAGRVDFGGGMVGPGTSMPDQWLAAYDTNGRYLRARWFGSGNLTISSLAPAGTSQLYTSGLLQGFAWIGPNELMTMPQSRYAARLQR